MKSCSLVQCGCCAIPCLNARFKHLIQNSFQRVVFQSRSNPLLVGKLFVHLVILAVGIFSAKDVDAVVWWQALFQSNPDAKPQDCGERTMRDSRGNFNRHLDDGVGIGYAKSWRRSDVDVVYVDDGELP